MSHKMLDDIDFVSNLTPMTQASAPDEYHLEFTKYGPSDVSRITGVSSDLLRDWRRRGIIKASDFGSSVYTSLTIAQIMLRRALSDVGVPLTASEKSADLGALYVLGFALGAPKAIEEPADISSASVRGAINELQLPSDFRYLLITRPQIVADDLSDLPNAAESFEQFGGLLPLPKLEVGLGIIERLQRDNRAEAWSVVDLRALGDKLLWGSKRPICRLCSGPRRAAHPVAASKVGGG